MAHNLNSVNGKVSFAAHGEVAWHGLGQYVNKAMTAEEAMKLANLDFKVVKDPMFVKNGKNLIEVPNRYATVRTDTKDILGVVGDRYEIIQNKDVFGFFDPIIESGEAIYETAGVLGAGERIFLTAKLPSDIEIRGDKIEQYILLTNSHNGFTPLYAGFTPVRVVCNNTLTAALKDLSNKVSIRHTVSAKQKINEAARIMGLQSNYMNFLDETFNKMAKVKINDKKLKDFVLSVLIPSKEQITKEQLEKEFSTRSENMCDEIMDFAKNHETQKTDAAKGTLWGAYNAISGYYNFNKDYNDPQEKMIDTMFNGVAAKVERAFKLSYSMLS